MNTYPHSTSVEFTAPPSPDGFAFGGPNNVRINGQPITGVQKIITCHEVEGFTTVVLVIKGCGVTISEPPHEPAAAPTPDGPLRPASVAQDRPSPAAEGPACTQCGQLARKAGGTYVCENCGTVVVKDKEAL